MQRRSGHVKKKEKYIEKKMQKKYYISTANSSQELSHCAVGSAFVGHVEMSHGIS